MKITNSVEKNGYPQLIQDCNASTIEEIIERVLHSITGKFDSARISQRGLADPNITLWNKTFENGSTTGSIWVYVDSSSTAEDVSITFDVWSVQTVLLHSHGVSITTEPYLNDVTVLKNGWNTYPVYQRRWG